MPKLPDTFDWRNSPGHIALLNAFSSPRDIEQVLDWEHLREGAPEPVPAGIARLKQVGALIPASLEEKFAIRFKLPELKALVKARGIKGVEGKQMLIEALIQADRQAAESLVGSMNVLKCSEIGLKVIQDFRDAKDQADEAAQTREIEALLNSDPGTAYKIHKKHMKDMYHEFQDYYMGEMLGSLFIGTPTRLLKEFGENGLRILRMVAGMNQLWHHRRIPITQWIPDDFPIEREKLENGIELMKRSGRLQQRLAEWRPNETVQLSFEDVNLEVCDYCRKLDGKVLKVSEFPEWPFDGCENEVGCLPGLDNYYELDEGEDSAEIDLYSTENPLELLRQLKTMMDEKLITDQEYQEKKKEILSRM